MLHLFKNKKTRSQVVTTPNLAAMQAKMKQDLINAAEKSVADSYVLPVFEALNIALPVWSKQVRWSRSDGATTWSVIIKDPNDDDGDILKYLSVKIDSDADLQAQVNWDGTDVPVVLVDLEASRWALMMAIGNTVVETEREWRANEASFKDAADRHARYAETLAREVRDGDFARGPLRHFNADMFKDVQSTNVAPKETL